MDIEKKIRQNATSFYDVKMPEGSRQRFEARLRSETSRRITADNVRKTYFMTWTSVATAAITILIVATGIFADNKKATTPTPPTADNKLMEMRRFYDAKMDEAILDLEKIMSYVDDSTRMHLNSVIDGLLNMGDVFAEMAPIPEEKQMAIVEHLYDNKLKTLELLTNKFNKQ